MDSEARKLRSLAARFALVVLGAVLILVAWSGFSPGTAAADGFWSRVNPGNFNAYQWVENGVKTDRFLSEKAFNNMAERAAYGVQSLGTGVGTGYSTQAQKGAEIINSMKTVATTAGTVATVRGLKGDTLSLMTRLKSYGLLKGLGTAALVGTAFETGWKIGSAISSLWTDDPQEGNGGCGTSCPTLHAVSAVPVEKGEVVKATAETPVKVFNTPAPADGFIVKFRLGESGEFRETTALKGIYPNCSSATALGVQPKDTPANAIQIPVGETFCAPKAGVPTLEAVETRAVWFFPLKVQCLPGDTGSGCPGKPKTTVTGSAQTPVNGPAGTKIVEACLVGSVACGAFPGWWWNHDKEAQESTGRVGSGVDLDPAEPGKVRVPKFGRHEHFETYGAKLAALELTAEYLVLPEGFENPAYGPEEVTQVNPKPTTQLQPETVVKVRYNPATAPTGTPGQEGEAPPTGGGGPWSPPGIPSIDMSPLSGIPNACSVFPFGVLCWLGDALSQFNTAGVCPHFDAPVADTGSDFSFTFCGETAETVMGYLRPAILLAFTIGVGFLFARATRAVGGD